MGRSAFVLRFGLAMLGAMLAGIGCQQQRAPMRMTVVGDPPGGARFVENKETPYVNPVWLDADVEPPSTFDKAITVTQTAFGAVVNPVVEFSVASFNWANSDRPSNADRLLEDKTSADNRREGMNRLAEFGFLKNELFTKRCRQIAQSDTDYTVRATAIRTANRARDAKATTLFINGLGDPNDWVRLESAKALANVPDVRAIEPLIYVSGNALESRDIRVAAVDALKHYRTLPVARALSAGLTDRNFVIAWQAKRSLSYLTDRDYGYDGAAWLAYFTGTGKP